MNVMITAFDRDIKTAVLTDGSTRISPERISNFQPCQAQCTISPARLYANSAVPVSLLGPHTGQSHRATLCGADVQQRVIPIFQLKDANWHV